MFEARDPARRPPVHRNRPHRRTRLVVWPAALTLLGLVAGGAVGETATKKPPRGIPMGIFRVHPQLLVESRWEDNIYKTETDPRPDLLVRIKPTIRFITHWRKNSFSADYTAEVERYQDTQIENNSGHRVNLALELMPSRRFAFGFGYEFLLEHEDRGTIDSAPLVIGVGPNKWQQHTVSGMGQFTFHRLRARLDASHVRRESVNNSQFVQDRHWNDTALSLLWALAPKTALLTEFGWKRIRYDESPLLDSDERRILAGVTWKATHKTEGRIKVGGVDKVFVIDQGLDTREVTWDNEIVWKPQRRTQVNLAAKRVFQEGQANTDPFVSTDFRTDVSHELKHNWTLTTGFNFANGDYGALRQEDYWQGELGMNYRLPRWFTLNGEYQRSAKRSTDAGADHDSNAVLFSVLGAM